MELFELTSRFADFDVEGKRIFADRVRHNPFFDYLRARWLLTGNLCLQSLAPLKFRFWVEDLTVCFISTSAFLRFAENRYMQPQT